MTEAYIMKLLNNYIESPAGKKTVGQYKKDIINGKKSSVGTGILSKSEMIVMGEKMRGILASEITRVIPSFSVGDIIVSEPIEDINGEYKISITISPAALHRDSLWQEKYPDGVDNILLLFTRGYQASGSVYGLWHGENIRSKPYRAPNDFLQRSVNTFNAISAQKAIAELGDVYK